MKHDLNTDWPAGAPEPHGPRTPQRPDWSPPLPPQPRSPAEDVAAPMPDGWLAQRLHEHRIVLINGPLDVARANRAAAELLALDATASHRIRIHLDSPDGDLGAALSLTDTIDLLRVSVQLVALGEVGGPVLALLTAADQVLAHPHARFHLSEPRVEISGRADEVAIAAEHHAAMLRDLVNRIAEAAGRPAEEIAEDLRRGRYLTAGEAVDYGLVDRVVSREPKESDRS